MNPAPSGSKRPLLGLAVVYGAGIWLESRLGWPLAILAGAVAVLLAVFLLLWRYPRCCLIILLLAVLGAGMVAQRHAAEDAVAPCWARLRRLCDQRIGLRGMVATAPQDRRDDATGVIRHSFQLELSAFRDGVDWWAATGRIQMFVRDRSGAPLRYGDALECEAILRAPAPARNPDTFDWREWLAGQRIYFTATVLSTDKLSVQGHDRGNPIIAWSARLRDRMERALRQGLENEPAVAGVLAGMVIGERAAIPPDTHGDFQRTGAFHVFAINGLHVGLVTVVVLIVLRLLGIPRRWAGAAAIPLLVLYVLATGAHPGAVRALVMASVWLVGRMVVRPAETLNSLAAAALLILLWEPLQLFDGGFILSFTVVTAIVVLAPPLFRWLAALVAPDPLLPRQFQPHWRTWLDRPLRYGLGLLSCALAAWIGLWPLLALDFHLFTPLSIGASLVVLPLLTAVIALGLAAILAQAVWPWLAVTFNNANFLVLSIMMRAMAWLAKIPHGFCYVRAPARWLIVVYYVWLLVLVVPGLSGARRRWSTALVVLIVVVGLWLGRGPRELAEITVSDLTDGPAAFVDLRGSQDGLLIDGGGRWSGERVVLPFLRAQGVDRLGRMVLTCADSAHAAGQTALVREMPVGEAIQSGRTSPSVQYLRWQQAMRAHGVLVRILAMGETAPCGSRLRLRAVHPPRDTSFSRREDNALVFLMEYGPTRILWMSDAGAAVEQRLLATMPELRADVIVRRGDEPACSAGFLAAVQPQAVVLATSARPDREDASSLQRRVSDPASPVIYRTDELGAIRIRLTPRGYGIGGFLDRGGRVAETSKPG